jgi:hypothetical protein
LNIMQTDNLIINLACLDMGIVPLCDGAPGHLGNSLNSLSPQDRRAATRKFRKLLKRVIHKRALTQGLKGSPRYETAVQADRYHAGLDRSCQHPTRSQSNYRAHLVRSWLRDLAVLD